MKFKAIEKKLIDDFKGAGKVISIPNIRKLTGGYDINISKYSGLVSVIKRRSSKKIADEWSNKIFGTSFTNKTYTARIPAVTARLTYVLETIISELKVKSKSICDLGAGEGDFLKMLKQKKLTKNIFAVEPSIKNCKLLNKNNIKNFQGTIEDYANKKKKRKFDILTLMWTLCNTSNCYDVISSVNKLCKNNGYIVVAESSRILVPFKKPIQMYVSKGNPDIHPFHFSKNSLCNLLLINNFKPIYINRYLDSDWLLIIAKKQNKISKKNYKIDNYLKVKKFFLSWYSYSNQFKDELKI